MSDLSQLRKLKEAADKSSGFKERFLQVLTAKGFSEADIEEAKDYVRRAWSDPILKECWINWINEEYKVWR